MGLETIIGPALGVGAGAGLAVTGQNLAVIMQVAGVMGASIAGGMTFMCGSADAPFSKLFGRVALGYSVGMVGAVVAYAAKAALSYL